MDETYFFYFTIKKGGLLMDVEELSFYEAIIKELKKINQKLDNIDSNTSSTDHNVSMLEYKLEEIKQLIEE